MDPLLYVYRDAYAAVRNVHAAALDVVLVAVVVVDEVTSASRVIHSLHILPTVHLLLRIYMLGIRMRRHMLLHHPHLRSMQGRSINSTARMLCQLSTPPWLHSRRDHNSRHSTRLERSSTTTHCQLCRLGRMEGTYMFRWRNSPYHKSKGIWSWIDWITMAV